MGSHNGEILQLLGSLLLRSALKLCCVPDAEIDAIERRQRKSDGARLICYLDGMSEQLVARQLEFRKERRLSRVASKNSLSSLGSVSENSELLPQRMPSGGTAPPMKRVMSTPSSMSGMSSLQIEPRQMEPRVRNSSSDERLLQSLPPPRQRGTRRGELA